MSKILHPRLWLTRLHIFLVQLILLVWHRQWRSLDDILYHDERGVWP